MNESELYVKYKSSYASASVDLVSHSGVLFAGFYSIWYFKTSWFSIFTIPIMALLITRTFIIFHDSCHRSYIHNVWLNSAISHVTGIIVLTSPNWALDHYTHHLTNGNLENSHNYAFNETASVTKKQYLALSEKNQRLFRLSRNPFVFFTILPFIYFVVIQRFRYIVKKIKRPNKYEQSFFEIAAIHAMNNIGAFYYLRTVYYFGILPHMIISYFAAYSIGFMLFHNQHTYNPAYVVGKANWSFKDSGLIGSSFLQIPRYLKYFFMGIEYHHIHHMNAKIPGYNLQKYHEEVTSKSDVFDNIHVISMSEFYQNLWLIIYDEDAKRYVTMDEIHNNKTD
jgi:omega-6 fatty acid desaturase (delta-12 desaturase)